MQINPCIVQRSTAYIWVKSISGRGKVSAKALGRDVFKGLGGKQGEDAEK